MKKVKVKSLNVDLKKVPFKNPKKVNDGSNGKILETEMIKQGFPLNRTKTVDLPLGIEVKSRKATTSSHHTVGTMTYDDIINTPWDQTTFKEKLQTQYRVTIKENEIDPNNHSATGKIVDFSHPEIQKEFEKSYEDCRKQLINQGGIITGQTIKGGQYGVLEHKPGPNGTGKSFAMRIPDSGMKKAIGTANALSNNIFSFE